MSFTFRDLLGQDSVAEEDWSDEVAAAEGAGNSVVGRSANGGAPRRVDRIHEAFTQDEGGLIDRLQVSPGSFFSQNFMAEDSLFSRLPGAVAETAAGNDRGLAESVVSELREQDLEQSIEECPEKNIPATEIPSGNATSTGASSGNHHSLPTDTVESALDQKQMREVEAVPAAAIEVPITSEHDVMKVESIAEKPNAVSPVSGEVASPNFPTRKARRLEAAARRQVGRSGGCDIEQQLELRAHLGLSETINIEQIVCRLADLPGIDRARIAAGEKELIATTSTSHLVKRLDIPASKLISSASQLYQFAGCELSKGITLLRGRSGFRTLLAAGKVLIAVDHQERDLTQDVKKKLELVAQQLNQLKLS